MIFLIFYSLAILSFACWILGWCFWHAYLAFSRFFKTHNLQTTNLKFYFRE